MRPPGLPFCGRIPLQVFGSIDRTPPLPYSPDMLPAASSGSADVSAPAPPGDWPAFPSC